MTTRRGFLGALLAAAAAPAIARAGSLMPIYVPRLQLLTLWGDGVHDDSQALQALVDGKRVLMPDGSPCNGYLPAGILLVSNTIYVPEDGPPLMDGRLRWAGDSKGPMIHLPATRRTLALSGIHVDIAARTRR